jgi:hypothetical protein
VHNWDSPMIVPLPGVMAVGGSLKPGDVVHSIEWMGAPSAPPRLLDGEAPPPYYQCVSWAARLASYVSPVSSPLSYALTRMRVGRLDLGAWLSGVGLANSGELCHRGAGCAA